MILYSYPSNFSSIFATDAYEFREVEPESPTEITFHQVDGTTLGARRFVGRSTIVTSPEAWLRRAIDPQPYMGSSGGCELVQPEGRSVALYATYDNSTATTPIVHFTASHRPLAYGSVLGGASQSRRIALGESDEIAFVPNPLSKVGVEVLLSDGTAATILTQDGSTEGIAVVVVVADAIVSLSSNPANVEWFEVAIRLDGERVATHHYTLVEHPCESVRLAWLNADGYISYHTFAPAVEERTATSRTECSLVGGCVTLAVEGWSECCLESGFVAPAELEHLRGIATTPRLWRIEPNGSAVAQRVLGCEVCSDQQSGYRLSLRICPARAECFW